MAEQAALHLDGVTRRFRQGNSLLEILRGANLSVWPGESVALIAPSGAGKSTLLQIAGLLEFPDGGEVFIGGRPTTGLPDSALPPPAQPTPPPAAVAPAPAATPPVAPQGLY